ncbi:MAG: hypothetical protein AAGJ34_07005 [Pseudomonadota bacterium]
MIRPVLYPDLVAMARVYMTDPQDKDLVGRTCDQAHVRGWSLEDATSRLPKVDGFSLNSNRGLSALVCVAAQVLAWRRENGLP